MITLVCFLLIALIVLQSPFLQKLLGAMIRVGTIGLLVESTRGSRTRGTS
jgi:hypothetical protein